MKRERERERERERRERERDLPMKRKSANSDPLLVPRIEQYGQNHSLEDPQVKSCHECLSLAVVSVTAEVTGVFKRPCTCNLY